MPFATRSPRGEDRLKPRCDDCGGTGKHHICGMGACVDLDGPCPTCKGSKIRPLYRATVKVTPNVMNDTILLEEVSARPRRLVVKGAALQDVMLRLGKAEILAKILTRTDVTLFAKVFRSMQIAKDITGYLTHEMAAVERVFTDDEAYFGKPPAPESDF